MFSRVIKRERRAVMGECSVLKILWNKVPYFQSYILKGLEGMVFSFDVSFFGFNRKFYKSFSKSNNSANISGAMSIFG